MCNLLHPFPFCQELEEHNLETKCDFGEMKLLYPKKMSADHRLLPSADVPVNQHQCIVVDAYNP